MSDEHPTSPPTNMPMPQPARAIVSRHGLDGRLPSRGRSTISCLTLTLFLLSVVGMAPVATAQNSSGRAAVLGQPISASPFDPPVRRLDESLRPLPASGDIEQTGYLHAVGQPFYDELPPPVDELPVPRYERLARMEGEHPKPWSFDMVYIPQSGMDAPSTNVTMFEVGGTYSARIPFYERFLFTIKPIGDVLFLSGPGGPEPVLPPQLYKTAVDLQLDFRFNDKWGASLGFTPGLWTDYVRVESSSFRFPVRVLATYRWSDTLFIAGGLIYTDNFYRNLYPAVGAIWDIYDRTRLELLFPRSRIIYSLMDAWQVYFVVERGGDTYDITTVLTDEIVNEQMQYRDYRILLGTEVGVWQRAAFLAEVGWVFYRKFRFDDQPDRNIDSQFILRAGVRF